MSTKLVTSCDICGVDKKESNHWFKVWIHEGRFISCSSLDSKAKPSKVKDACGPAHAMTFYQRWLQYSNLDSDMDNAAVTEKIFDNSKQVDTSRGEEN